MKTLQTRTKYLLCGIFCLVFVCLLMSQVLWAEEVTQPAAEVTLVEEVTQPAAEVTQPAEEVTLLAEEMTLLPEEEAPQGSYDGANLVAVDAQGVKYVFSPDESTGTGYSTTAKISIQGVLKKIDEEGTADITIPSTITIGLPVTDEGATEPHYDPVDFPITEVIRADGDLINETNAEKISRFTFADGIQKVSGCSDILNLVQDVTLPDTLTCLKDSVYGAKVTDSAENIEYPRGNVPAWVQTLAGNSDHIAYAGTVALWVDPEVERDSLTFKADTTCIAWFAAMGNTKITTATIPGTVTELGDGVFYGCKNLTIVDIQSKSITSLPYIMFTNTSLSSIKVPASVEKIAAQCFYNARDLQIVTFEDNSQCKLIDYRAFADSGLTGIEIPSGVTEIGVEAFRNATALASVTFAENSNCQKIDYSAFKNCPSLEAFVLPDRVTEIASLAFMGCTNLKNFEISDNSQLRKIDDGAFGWLFYKNTDDTTGYGVEHYPAFYIREEDGAVTVELLTAPSQYGCPIEEINLPYNVSLGVGLFAGNKALKKVTFQAKPETAETGGSITIPFKAFYGCGALESVDFNGNIAKIDTNAFTYCKSLQSVDLTGVTKVDYAAFADTGLTGELVIPKSLTDVGTMSFAQCPGIDKITLNSTLESKSDNLMFRIIGQDCRENITGTHYINPYGPGKQEQFKIFSNEDYRKKFPTQTAPKTIVINGVQVGEKIKSALDYSICGCGLLNSMAMVEEVIIGDGVKEIVRQACFGCVSLKTVTLPESIETIGDLAFFNDEQLTGIDFTKLPNLTSIGQKAFMIWQVDGSFQAGTYDDWYADLPNNGGLDEIVLPENVINIGESAFLGQRNAKKIIVKSEKAVIRDYAFLFCNQVEEIEVASENFTTGSWNSIFWNERQSCLEKVTLSGKSKTGGRAYDNMYGLQMKEIDLSSTGITTIYKGMLNDCMSLEKVTLGDTITTIEPIAFLSCRALKNIVLPKSVEKLDIAAFARSGLEQIVILNPEMKFMKPVEGTWNSDTSTYEVDDPDTETAYNGIFDLATISNTLPVMPNVTIYGFKDSTAEAYAKEHGNRFVPLINYTITFDSNGGSEVEPQTLSNMPGEETYVQEPTKPTKAGYSFKGWFVKHEPQEEGEEATYTKFVFGQAYDSDMTVYAQWEKSVVNPGGGWNPGGSSGIGQPADTNKPTEKPEDTDKPTEKPADTDKPTEKPEDTDKPTEKPEDTDKPTEKPEDTDKPTEKPVDTPASVKDLKLNKAKLNVGTGDNFKLADILPAGAKAENFTFKSSKASVVTIKNGKLVAKKKGSATITVTDSNGKKIKFTVTVKKKPNKVTLNTEKKTLEKGKAVTLKANLPRGTASYKLTWTSSNKKVATVSSRGKVKALKKGTAKITVKTYNGKKATCIIKVD